MSRWLFVGIPREIMRCEGRIPLLPYSISSVKSSLKNLHDDLFMEFLVESDLGRELGFTDKDWEPYALVLKDRAELYRRSDIILKVKQPFLEEVELYHEEQGSFCFHHPATNKQVVKELMAKGVKILPFEYYRPALDAMSREAGKRVGVVLDVCYGKRWEDENFLVLGARGVVGQYAVQTLISRGIKPE